MPPLRPVRPVLRQDFTPTQLSVGTGATPISGALSLQSLVTSFVINVPSTAANSVFLGNGGVTITNGFEIEPGSAPAFIINNYKQPYELQGPLLSIQGNLVNCLTEADALPFICWDPSTIYLVAAAATNVSLLFFTEVFVQ